MVSNRIEVTDLSDIIGTTGYHQALSLVITLYLCSISGCSTIFVQFLAPEITIKWKTNDTNFSSPKWNSLNCYIDDINMVDFDIESSELEYYSKYSYSTLTEKLSLICERSWLVSLGTALVMAGGFFGGTIFGQIAEKFGRRKIFFYNVIPATAANIMILFSTNYAMFAAGCFIYGLTSLAIGITSFVTLTECVALKFRSHAGILAQFGTVLGQLVVALLAWIFKNWFYTQLAHTVFAGSAIFCAWFLVESPMWLVVVGRETEARTIVKTILKRNKRETAEDDLKISLWIEQIKNRSVVSRSLNEGKFYDLLKTKTIRIYYLSLVYITMTVTFSYYGLALNTESIGNDIYLDFVISSAVGIVSMFLILVFLWYQSVKRLMMSFIALFIATCAIYPLIYNVALDRSIVSYLARFWATIPIISAYIYTAQVLPTTVRAIGAGFQSSLARLVCVLCPFAKDLAMKTTLYAPFLIFGALNIVNLLLFWFVLPETQGKHFSNTVKDLENEADIKKKNLESEENSTQA